MISVILPIYNAETYLDESIDSVLAQSYSNWELILVNDGSTDKSERIALKYKLKYNRISYFKQENKGVSSARNLGLSVMKGDFFCFLDADDLLPDKSLELRLGKLKTDKYDCVDGSINIFNEEIKNITGSYTPRFNGIPIIELVRLTGSCFFGITWLMRNKEDIIPFDESISHGEDLLFLIENYGLSQFTYTKEIVLYYRKGHNSAMSNLLGLERGYKSIYAKLKLDSQINSMDLSIMKLKVKKFMILDYLKRLNLVGVLRMIFW